MRLLTLALCLRKADIGQEQTVERKVTAAMLPPLPRMLDQSLAVANHESEWQRLPQQDQPVPSP